MKMQARLDKESIGAPRKADEGRMPYTDTVTSEVNHGLRCPVRRMPDQLIHTSLSSITLVVLTTLCTTLAPSRRTQQGMLI
jgi:hypothetical protein